MNLALWLQRTARVFPQRPAISVGRDEVCRYGELARRAATLAWQLRQRFGLVPGERVALFLRNAPAYLELLYGIWQAGLVAVPVNAKLHPKELDFILQDCGARLLFTDSAVVARCEVVDPGSAAYTGLLQGETLPPWPASGDDLAWLFYTSGTTGRPKGVMLSHANLQAMTLCGISDVDAVDLQDSILYAAPMSHGAGMYNFAYVLRGAHHVVPESGGFDEDEIFALAGHHGRVSMFAAPTMVRRLVEHCEQRGTDPSGIKTVVYGGGPMYAEDIRRALRVMGQRFVQIYGQGESPMTITALSRHHLADAAHPRHLQRIASVGVAQSAVDVQVLDAEGRPLPDGEPGEVCVRGPTVMRGYWNNPEATTQALAGGWLHTGDIGVFDGDGFLTLKDRSKDMIISGGSNIYPREVEEVLLLHPDVAEVSVVGRSSAEWGEDVVAFVVCRDGAAVRGSDLDALCVQHIARFKRPKDYRFVAALPKNNYGKVLKGELRAQLAP